MSQIFRQGLNWIIIDFISNLELANEVSNDVNTKDFSDFTSAKGPNSVQNYIINPRWMPSDSHTEPKGWPDLRSKWEDIVQREVVNYGLMPSNWKKLHACSAWTVKGEEGSYHTIHEHGPLNVSSVTYLEVPPRPINLTPSTEPPKNNNQGQIYFVMDGGPYNSLSVPNFRLFHITPQPGMIVIFPSWMLHGVYPQGPGIRRTLNIDFNGDPNYKFDIPHSGSSGFGG